MGKYYLIEIKASGIFYYQRFTEDISQVDLIGLILGHLVFAIAMIKLLDWKWLANLMSKEDKIKMLSYTWKDLLVDGAIFAVVIVAIFLVISIFL